MDVGTIACNPCTPSVPLKACLNGEDQMGKAWEAWGVCGLEEGSCWDGGACCPSLAFIALSYALVSTKLA